MSTSPDLLILGATGQIGACLLRRSTSRSTLAIARRPPPGATGWRSADLTTSRVDWGRLPATGIATVPLWLLPNHLEGLAKAGLRRLVCFSSTSIMGKDGTQSPRERTQVTALVGAEAMLAKTAPALGLGISILRPTLIYGFGRDANVSAAARFITRFGFYPLSPPALGQRQPVHADDLAAAAIAVAGRDDLAGSGFALGGGETLTYREMIGRIFDALGRPRRLVPVPGLPALAGLYGRLSGQPSLTPDAVRRMNRHLVFDRGEAARAFGYAPRTFLSAGSADLGL